MSSRKISHISRPRATIIIIKETWKEINNGAEKDVNRAPSRKSVCDRRAITRKMSSWSVWMSKFFKTIEAMVIKRAIPKRHGFCCLVSIITSVILFFQIL